MRTLRPDVLVLGGGGVLGEAWMMGVLAGLEDGAGVDLRDCDGYVGTSAGSIVAAHLIAGRSPRRPSTLSAEIAVTGTPPAQGLALAVGAGARRAARVALAAAAPLVSPALSASAPGRALARGALLRALPRAGETLGRLRAEVEASGARFDGRLRVVAVDRARGQRVVFGRPGAPPATVAAAVQASCAVPWLFAPVVIDGRDYVDGGVWSPTNLDAAPAGRGTHVLCLAPTAGLARTTRPLAAIRELTRSAMAVEALALRGRGARVVTVAPNAESAIAIGPDLMAAGPRLAVLAAGYRQGLTLAA